MTRALRTVLVNREGVKVEARKEVKWRDMITWSRDDLYFQHQTLLLPKFVETKTEKEKQSTNVNITYKVNSSYSLRLLLLFPLSWGQGTHGKGMDCFHFFLQYCIDHSMSLEWCQALKRWTHNDTIELSSTPVRYVNNVLLKKQYHANDGNCHKKVASTSTYEMSRFKSFPKLFSYVICGVSITHFGHRMIKKYWTRFENSGQSRK